MCPGELQQMLRDASEQGRQKRFMDALQTATYAKTLDPTNPSAEALVGQALFGMGRFEDSQKSFKRSKELLAFEYETQETAQLRLKCDQGILACSRRLGLSETESSDHCKRQDPAAFPRTPHLAFSPGIADDDIVRAPDSQIFDGKEVVIMEKLDGGNCCFWRGVVYARSHTHQTSLPWFSTAKQIASVIAAQDTLPGHVALFLENMEAVHSIDYGHLPSPLFVIAALNTETDTFLSWNETAHLARSLALPTPPVLHRGHGVTSGWLEAWAAQQQGTPSLVGDKGAGSEGFVVREAGAIAVREWGLRSAKFVRRGHVQTPPDFHRTWKKASFDLPMW